MDRKAFLEQKDFERGAQLRGQESYLDGHGRVAKRRINKNIKAGTPISVRVNFSTIAAIASYLFDVDGTVYPKSTCLRIVLESVARDLMTKDQKYCFSETSGIRFLDEVGILNEDRNALLEKRIHNELKIESLIGSSRESEMSSEADQLDMRRIIARRIFEDSGEISQEQLDLAEMEIICGKLVEKENIKVFGRHYYENQGKNKPCDSQEESQVSSAVPLDEFKKQMLEGRPKIGEAREG